MQDELSSTHYTNIIDEIYNYPQNYMGFVVSPQGGTVKLLSYKFKLDVSQVLVVLNQMISDSQLVSLGYDGFQQTYGPISER